MTITYGPKLGLMINGTQGEEHYAQLMALLRAVDGLVQCSVIDHTLSTPPGGPSDGDCYIVAASGATGAWATNENKIARYSSIEAAWEFYSPLDGWVAWSDAAQLHAKYTTAGGWEGLVSPLPAPADPGVFVVTQGSATLFGPDNAVAFSEGSGTFTSSGIARATPKSSGKRYFELNSDAILSSNQDTVFGFSEYAVFGGYNQLSHSIADYSGTSAILVSDGLFKANGSTISDPLTTVSDIDVFGFAVDIDAGLVWITKNGTEVYGDASAGTGGVSYGTGGVSVYPFVAFFNSDLDAVISILEGSLGYTPPTGFVAWGAP